MLLPTYPAISISYGVYLSYILPMLVQRQYIQEAPEFNHLTTPLPLTSRVERESLFLDFLFGYSDFLFPDIALDVALTDEEETFRRNVLITVQDPSHLNSVAEERKVARQRLVTALERYLPVTSLPGSGSTNQ